jgi:membrane-associated HD superfamily phosphohydrolase
MKKELYKVLYIISFILVWSVGASLYFPTIVFLFSLIIIPTVVYVIAKQGGNIILNTLYSYLVIIINDRAYYLLSDVIYNDVARGIAFISFTIILVLTTIIWMILIHRKYRIESKKENRKVIIYLYVYLIFICLLNYIIYKYFIFSCS